MPGNLILLAPKNPLKLQDLHRLIRSESSAVGPGCVKTLS